MSDANLLFIHGAWHGAWTWEEWVPLFAEHGYRPYALTLPGHDGADRSYRGVHLRDYVAAIRDAIAELPEPPFLVGHSLGGLLIQHLLAEGRYPAAVLLASVPARYPARVIARNAVRHPWAMTKATARDDLAAMVGTPALVRETLFTDSTPVEIVNRTQARVTGAWPGLFREMIRTKAPRPQPGTPTLVVAPERDRSFTVAMQHALAQRLAADYREIPGCGHDVPIDAPWRDTARAVLDWLLTAPRAHR